MKVLFIFLVYGFIFSVNSFAETLSNYSSYKNNPNLLATDLEFLNKEVKNNKSPVAETALKNLLELQKKLESIDTSFSMKNFQESLAENKWRNLERMAGELVDVCEVNFDLNSSACLTGLDEMKVFTYNSNLSSDNKELVGKEIVNFQQQYKILKTLDKNFELDFNTNVDMFNTYINNKSGKLSKIIIPKVNKPSPQKESLNLVSFKDKIPYAIGGVLLLFIYFISIYRKKKFIKSFYGDIFKLSKNKKISLRIFGKLLPNDVLILTKLQKCFLAFLSCSRAVSSKSNIKFKNRASNLTVEIIFFATSPIQVVANIPKEKSLKDSLSDLQKTVELIGGELVLASKFGPSGELTQTSVMLIVPR